MQAVHSVITSYSIHYTKLYDGSGSSDSDGSIASYLWSDGSTGSSLTVTVNATQTITLTVTDNERNNFV